MSKDHHQAAGEGGLAFPAAIYEDEVHFLTTTGEVEGLAKRLAGVTRIGVDLESDSFYHYYDKVCLLQLTADGVDYIVDPLGGASLSALAPMFADPSIEKIFHSADNDVHLLRTDLGFEVEGVFDTMIAAQLVGHRRFGLGDLVGHYFQVGMDKRYQRHNWSARPLLPEHLHYARSDTHFLSPLRDRLWEQIEARGRVAQAKEEFELVVRRRPPPKPFSADDCLKIQGVQELDQKELRVLRELFIAREEMAKQENLPPFRVLGNEALLHLAKRPPTSRAELANVRGMHPRLLRRYGGELLEAVARARSTQAPLPRPPPRKPRPADSMAVEARFQALRKWRQARAESLELDLAVVASNAILQSIAREAPTDLAQLRSVPLVRNWQVEDFGEEWLEVLRRVKVS